MWIPNTVRRKKYASTTSLFFILHRLFPFFRFFSATVQLNSFASAKVILHSWMNSRPAMLPPLQAPPNVNTIKQKPWILWYMYAHIYSYMCTKKDKRKSKTNTLYIFLSDKGTIKNSLTGGTVTCFNLNTCPTSEEMGHPRRFHMITINIWNDYNLALKKLKSIGG